MSRLSPTDSIFLIQEGRSQPMHVGSLIVFEPPDDHPTGSTRHLYEQLTAVDELDPLFRRRLHRAFGLGPFEWVDDDEIDLEYHVRHSALPAPGRVRELLALVSRLHGTLLDRHRPLWETHLIEGLEGDRFAIYTKMHHALVDGVAGTRLVQQALSEDPDERGMPPFFAKRSTGRRRHNGTVSPLAVLRSAASVPRFVAGLGGALVDTVTSGLRDQSVALPFRAPRTIFNASISGARRYAADGYPLDRIKAISKANGATVNDVVLAMCSGALRAYLDELGELPDQSLVAMVPVSIRRPSEADAAGNAVGSVLCQLGTQHDDPLDRLDAVRTSMGRAKRHVQGLDQGQMTLYSAAMIGGLALAPVQTRLGTPPPFNLVISNVPGPRRPLHWNGARAQGSYPLSIPTNGQAVNITVTSYVDEMEFGITGCRRRVPHLQRLLDHLATALDELEKATSNAGRS